MKKILITTAFILGLTFSLNAETPNATTVLEFYNRMVQPTESISIRTDALLVSLNENISIYPEFNNLFKVYKLMGFLRGKKNDKGEYDFGDFTEYQKYRNELLDDKTLPKEFRTLMDVIDLKALYLKKDYVALLERLSKYPKNSIFLAEPKFLGFKIYYPAHLQQNSNITPAELTKKIKEIDRLVKSINDNAISFDELENVFLYGSKVNETEGTYDKSIFKKYEFIFAQSIIMVRSDPCEFGSNAAMVPFGTQFDNEYKLASKLFIEKIGTDENKLVKALKLNFFETTENRPEDLKELFKKFAIKNMERPSRGIIFFNNLEPTKKMADWETLSILCKMKSEATGRSNACYGNSRKDYEEFINALKMDTAYFDDIANNFYSTSWQVNNFVFSALYGVEFSTVYAVFKLSNQELKFIGIYHVSHGAGCD